MFDSPAMRKVGGFVSHTAVKGCFKCSKCFPQNHLVKHLTTVALDKMIRALENMKNVLKWVCMKHKNAKTVNERNEIEKKWN